MTHTTLTATPFTTTEEDNTFNPYPPADSLTAMVEADKAAEKETEAQIEKFFTTTGHIILYAVIFIIVFMLVYQIIYQIRRATDPAYRERSDKQIEAYKQRQELRKQEKADRKRRRQRAIDSMSLTERLLYEQNKELRRIHWYLTLRDLFAPRRRR